MAVSKNKSRSVLGDNPLTQGIFSKTETNGQFQESIIKNQESRFLEKGDRGGESTPAYRFKRLAE